MFSIRYDDIDAHKNEIKKDIDLLNQCDFVICHNERMKKKLIEMGATCALYTLNLFDYLTNDKNTCVDRTTTTGLISFAGNLAKSSFLSKLDNNSECRYVIYGNPPSKFVHMQYEGSVDANELPNVIKGNYGLIWEGEYQVTEKDNYTRFNNPHKLSLYIASGMPVIIWNKSAQSDFVKKEGIGLCIDNLDEIDSSISSIDENTYRNMINNCNRIRGKLIKGEFLKNVLSIIENDARNIGLVEEHRNGKWKGKKFTS
jgi:hypothetical protein